MKTYKPPTVTSPNLILATVHEATRFDVSPLVGENGCDRCVSQFQYSVMPSQPEASIEPLGRSITARTVEQDSARGVLKNLIRGASMIGRLFRRAPRDETTVSFKKLLHQKGYKLKKDRELKSLLQEASRLMARDDLVTFIQKAMRFGNKVTHMTDTHPGQYLVKSISHVIYWPDIRGCLQQLPEYFDLTNTLGLTYDESVALLFDTIDALNHNHAYVSQSILPPLMSIFEGLIERGFELRDNLPVFREVLAAAQRRGDLSRAMRIIGLAMNAGIPFDRSMELVLYIYEHAGCVGYTFYHLYDELDSLRPNAADGETLFQALINISGKNPYYSRGNYATFATLMYVAATHTMYSQQEILERINEEAERQRALSPKSTLALKYDEDPESGTGLEVFQKLLPRASSDSTSGVPAVKEPEDYFPKLEVDTLIHGILPYRSHRGYRAGLLDLRKMAKEEDPEGVWVYDPDRRRWYSLGGKTSSRRGRARTEFFPFDISQLSRRPVFVHIHPEGNETFIAPHADSLALPQFQLKLTKFLASMPSRGDFATFAELLEVSSQKVPFSALIVNSTGITEVRIPSDLDRVRELAPTFRDLKDAVLMQFDLKGYYKAYGIEEDDLVFVRRLTARLNAQLPEGFQIIVHDFDQYLENIQ